MLLTTLFKLDNLIKDTCTYGIGVDNILITFKIMTDYQQKTMINFKKAVTLLNKIMKMMEDKEYCINIMQQNLAVIGLLKSAHQMLMENHLNTCFKNAMQTNNEKKKQEMIQEILKVSKLANK